VRGWDLPFGPWAGPLAENGARRKGLKAKVPYHLHAIEQSTFEWYKEAYYSSCFMKVKCPFEYLYPSSFSNQFYGDKCIILMFSTH